MKGFHPNQQKRRVKLSKTAIFLLITLLLLPGLSVFRIARAFDARLVYGYFAVVSGITFWLYWHDKRRAQGDGWRTPESTLHFLEVIGGWPAAFVAQRSFRHKIAKRRYQMAYWGIVAFHEIICFDFLNHWHYLRSTLALLGA